MMTVDDECLAVTEEYLKTTASAAQACVCIFQYYNEHQRLLPRPNDSNDVQSTRPSTGPLFGSKIHYCAVVQYPQEIYH
jgi:hypothetical protein